MAFMATDTIYEDCNESSSDIEADAIDFDGDKSDEVVNKGERVEDPNFDSRALEDAITPSSAATKCLKLAATILFMNLCTVHGISSSFAEEFFTILHVHILLENNCLSKNHYAAKLLTKKLGLAYNTIHACKKGYVLFRGVDADVEKCPKCDQPRYKDIELKKFPIKVLWHFPIIVRFQQMFRSPSISKLMLWHSDNSSNGKGGNNLIRHPCNLKAWHHFHMNVDSTSSKDPQNAHLPLMVSTLLSKLV
jgi:hypothetical protein